MMMMMMMMMMIWDQFSRKIVTRCRTHLSAAVLTVENPSRKYHFSVAKNALKLSWDWVVAKTTWSEQILLHTYFANLTNGKICFPRRS